MKSIRWRPRDRDGRLMEPVALLVTNEDDTVLRTLASGARADALAAALVMDALALLDAKIVPAEEGPRDGSRPQITGRYFGHDATVTEREAGTEIERENVGPLRRGGAGHRALQAFAGGERLTAYDASVRASGDHHALRREATRLLVRGYLVKDGTLPNRAPHGRPHVDAYRLTREGHEELIRLADGDPVAAYTETLF